MKQYMLYGKPLLHYKGNVYYIERDVYKPGERQHHYVVIVNDKVVTDCYSIYPDIDLREYL